MKGCHCIGVGLHAGSWRNAKKAGFGIYGVKLAIIPKFHPADIITDGLNGPAWNAGYEHREIGFTARTWKSASDITVFTFCIGEFQNKHVLG